MSDRVLILVRPLVVSHAGVLAMVLAKILANLAAKVLAKSLMVPQLLIQRLSR